MAIRWPFFCDKEYFKKVENRVPKLSKKTLQALRILTNFGSFREKILMMTEDSEKQITSIVDFWLFLKTFIAITFSKA